MKKIKIAILDSGVRQDHPAFANVIVKGFSLKVKDDKVQVNSDYTDNIGHGTAVFYIVEKFAQNIDITNIKIFDNHSQLSQHDFELVLEYIFLHFHFDIINVSMGFLRCGNVSKLQKICDDLYLNGTLIISAFDNNGAVSFPAALNNVIGVDGQNGDFSSESYIFVDNSIINVIGKLDNYRVAWLNPEYIIVKGNSFLCAQVSAAVARCLQNTGILDWCEICTNRYSFSGYSSFEIPFAFNRMAVFPFNKETHSIARYESLLPTKNITYYSARITGHTGKKISDVLTDCNNNTIIQNIDNINWDEFDTLVLGHLGELSKLTGSNYGASLIKTAVEKNKNIYCFDNPQSMINDQCILHYKKLFFPKIDSTYLKKRFGKLYLTDKPIITVIGTNSKQGKFTLQLYLRKKFTELGYSVGQIGTEPSALLFGFDEVFHCGYNGQVDLDACQTYIAINDMIWNITQKDVDLILAGTQSGLLAYNDHNAMMFPTYHQTVFSALQTDAILLCINPYDDINFVERIIKTAEGLSGGQVLGVVCFPVNNANNWKGNFGKQVRISTAEEFELKQKYALKNIPVYMLDKPEELDMLVSRCVDFFR